MEVGGQGALGGGVPGRHQQHIGVALAEDVVDVLGVLAHLGVGAEHVAGAVVIGVGVGGQIGGHHDDHQHQHHGDHDPAHQPAEGGEAGQQRLVAGAVHPGQGGDHQGRHKGKDSQQAEGHTLGQGPAQVRADLELHQDQGHEADDGGQAAGQDGGGGFGQGLHHAVPGVGPRPGGADFLKPVDQEHRVIQGHSQLQNAAGCAGDKGDFPEHQVGAVVDEDGHTHAHHDQHRLGPAVGGEAQDEKDINHRNHCDLGHFHHRGVGGGGGGYRRTGEGALVPQQVRDFVHSLGPLGVLHRDGEQGRAVLIVGFHGFLVLHFQGDGDVHRVVQPGHRRDPVQLGDLLLIGQSLGDGDIPDHGPDVGNAAPEGVFHHGDGLGGRGGRGQVVVDVVVDRDQQPQKGAEYRGQDIQGQYPFAVSDNRCKKAFSFHEMAPF